MKIAILVFLLILSPIISAQGTDFSGLYTGTFKEGKFKTDIEFNIDKKDSLYIVSFNSLSQNAFGIPAGDIHKQDNSLLFALQSDFYRYNFELTSKNEKEVSSILKIDEHMYSFDLVKSESPHSIGLESKDIRFRSGPLLLYGTIYYPEDPNGLAIYLVTSSGNQDRSASRAEAILFAKEGFISFHIDKRGTGISDGNWELASIPELCEDDLHALEYLHQIEKIDYKNIGVKGSSQGGAKIPYLLKSQPNLGYGIVVSCPGSTLLESDLNYWENRHQDKISKSDIDNASKIQGAVFQYIATNISKQSLEEIIKENENQPWFKNIWVPELDKVVFDKKLNYSPLPYFEDLEASILVIQGSKDEIIPIKSIDIIKSSIGENGHKKNKFTVLKNANHAMMIEEDKDFKYWQSLHPKYMSSMLKWIYKL